MFLIITKKLIYGGYILTKDKILYKIKAVKAKSFGVCEKYLFREVSVLVDNCMVFRFVRTMKIFRKTGFVF